MVKKLKYTLPGHHGAFLSVRDPTDVKEIRTALTRVFEERTSLRAKADELARAFTSRNDWKGHIRTYADVFEDAMRKNRFRRRLSRLLR
jgi:crotonobetainyl-CoA:carnitine CoA-transferase CaiB-like acyl-CoA transferase